MSATNAQASNLADSTVSGSGINPLPLAPNIRCPALRQKKTTGPTPLVTEIAHSAFSLLNTHQTRIDRADLGLAQEEDDHAEQQRDSEDEGPVPRFPTHIPLLDVS